MLSRANSLACVELRNPASFRTAAPVSCRARVSDTPRRSAISRYSAPLCRIRSATNARSDAILQHKRKKRAHKCCCSRTAATDARIIFDENAMRLRSMAFVVGKDVGPLRESKCRLPKVNAASPRELKLSNMVHTLIWVAGNAGKSSRRRRMRQV